MMKKLICNGVSAVILALGALGTAQAIPYTSQEFIHNFTGGLGSPGSWNSYDTTWGDIKNDTNSPTWISGSYNFGSSAYLLSLIDSNFSSLYQVDSVTVKLKAAMAIGPPSETWSLLLGGGTSFDAAVLQFGNGTSSISLSENEYPDAFAIVAGGDPFQFRFKETTLGKDQFRAYYVSAVVQYSDIPIVATVPEPTSLALLGLGLAGLGFSRRRKSS